MHDAVRQWGNVGGLVAGLYSGNIDLIGRSMQDFVAEPYRKQFIPGFDELRKKVLDSGALAMNISGSGPSVFALCDHKNKANAAGWVLKQHFESLGIHSNVYVVKVSNKGAKLTGITI